MKVVSKKRVRHRKVTVLDPFNISTAPPRRSITRRPRRRSAKQVREDAAALTQGLIRENSQLGLYVLNSRGSPVRQSNPIHWAKWIRRSKNRTLKFDALKGNVEVSTVFLGVERHWTMSGQPMLWETMIFGGKHDGHCQLYASRADALMGHAIAVNMALLTPKKRAAALKSVIANRPESAVRR